MQLETGQTYKICIKVDDDDFTNRVKPRLKYIPARLIKEFKYFYLFQTKNYMTTIHKRDMDLIREVV